MKWFSSKRQSDNMDSFSEVEGGPNPTRLEESRPEPISTIEFGTTLTVILDLSPPRSDSDLGTLHEVKLAASNFLRYQPQSPQLLPLYMRVKQYLSSRVNQMEAESLYRALSARDSDELVGEHIVYEYIAADRQVHADIEAVREEVVALFWSTYVLFQTLNLSDRILEALNLHSIAIERRAIGHVPRQFQRPGAPEFPVATTVPTRALYRNISHGDSDQQQAPSQIEAQELAREMNNKMREMFGQY